MSAEKNLSRLIASMQPELTEGVFVFVTANEQLDLGNTVPQMQFREAEGMTYILRLEEAEAFGIDYEFPSRMITLNIHSSLDAVGFLATITRALAALEMGVNPVSAFYHDHLFVPVGREDDAMKALQALSATKTKE